MTPARPPRCPDCGGNLYLEPDLFEAAPEVVCLQCSRRFRAPHRPGPAVGRSADGGWQAVLPGSERPPEGPAVD